MLRVTKYHLLYFILAFLSASASAQQLVVDTAAAEAPEDRLTIRTIHISGNRKTKESIILRELPFRSGESYLLQDLVKKFEDGRRQLMNTSLFIDVVVALEKSEGYFVDVLVEVRERWYIFPVPYFKPVDRNLNQWLFEKNASLSRVNYGAKIMYNNVTGHNDKLRFLVISGYTHQLGFSYGRPFIDKKMRWGFNTSFGMGENKEVNYNTIDDKQVFYKSEKGSVHRFFDVNAEVTYRRAIKTTHSIGIGYTVETVGDTIVKLNPNFFPRSQKRIAYPEIYYRLSYFDLDYIPYPTKGYAAEATIGRKGITPDMNFWYINAKGSGSWHVNNRSFVNLTVYGGVAVPFHQPYYMQRFFGYGDAFLQGYEYYVVDGVAGGFLKGTFTRQLLNLSIRTPGKNRQLPERLPFRFYGKIFANTGYVYNPMPGNNTLSNRMLYSWGVGLDVFTSYDFTIKIEWTFNQLGQNGVFLHRKSIF